LAALTAVFLILLICHAHVCIAALFTLLLCCAHAWFASQLEILGLRKGFDARHGTASTPLVWEASGPPILFIYGGDKGFKFHSEGFERKLKARSVCTVVPLKKGDQGCPARYKVGHWCQVSAADRVNEEMTNWLTFFHNMERDAVDCFE
jgi:hypothetical protein